MPERAPARSFYILLLLFLINLMTAGTSQMTEAFRAIGLQSAMTLVVPLAIALTCISLFFAARSFIADARKTASVGQPIGGLVTAA
jgi:hypothetical protein